METLFRRGFSRDEMKKRVARFKDLQGSDGGLPDSNMPGCERTLFNVIGFQPPKGEGDSVTSPVGGDASRAAAIPISEGFNLGYCKAKPGHGPMMHNHDTNETFIPMTGKWRCSWENEDGRRRVSRPRSARRHFLSARGDPALRECDPRRQEPGAHLDVRDRRRRSARGIHRRFHEGARTRRRLATESGFGAGARANDDGLKAGFPVGHEPERSSSSSRSANRFSSHSRASVAALPHVGV